MAETCKSNRNIERHLLKLTNIIDISVWPLTALGIEPQFTIPHSVKLDEVVLANGLIGSVLSDYFWYANQPTLCFLKHNSSKVNLE